jgi:hypothetical protein
MSRLLLAAAGASAVPVSLNLVPEPVCLQPD